jgi:hypothetical protein
LFTRRSDTEHASLFFLIVSRHKISVPFNASFKDEEELKAIEGAKKPAALTAGAAAALPTKK